MFKAMEQPSLKSTAKGAIPPKSAGRKPRNGSSTRMTQVERKEIAERKIVEAAIQIIGEKGLNGVTLAAAGETAGYSRGIASHHFGKKDQLLIAIIRHITREFRTEMGEPLNMEPGFPMLLEVVRQYVNRVQRDVIGTRAFHLILSEGNSNPAIKDAIVEANTLSIKGFKYHLRKAIDKKEIRDDVDIQAQATLLLGALRGLMAQWLVNPENIDLPHYRDELIENLRLRLSPN